MGFFASIAGGHSLGGRGAGGEFDVVVCDGFVGNILLKFYESVAKLFHKLVDRELGAEIAGGEGFKRIWYTLDYARFGGVIRVDAFHDEQLSGVLVRCGESVQHATVDP